MYSFFDQKNIYKFSKFVKGFCNYIITFSQDLFNKLISIKDIKVNSLSDLQTAAPLIFHFLIGLLYVFLIISFLSYSFKIYNVLKFIFILLFISIKIILVFLFNCFKGILLFVTYPYRKLKSSNNNSQTQQAIEKELLVLRLQNEKLKKQLEQKHIK
jgi:uncharacterized membrane protein YesL